MKSRCLYTAVLLFLAVLPGRSQDKPVNPFRDATVGDYVWYVLIIKAGKVEIPMTVTVCAKDDKGVTLKSRIRGPAGQWVEQEIKIDLTKPYDPVTAAATQNNPKVKFEKTGQGKETIKVGDKTFQCDWAEGKLISEADGTKLESEAKMWFSEAVPLTGLVKMEVKSSSADFTMEFWKSGNEKNTKSGAEKVPDPFRILRI